MKYAILYLLVISLVAVIVTVADKKAAKIDGARRVPAKTLLLLSTLGGSVAMFITMKWIRHKTQHVKFMLGIPLIIIAQVGVLYYLIFHLDVFGWM